MPVTAWQDFPRVYSGQIVLEDLSSFGQVDVSALINADITAYIPSTYVTPASATYWGLSVQITEYDNSAVKFISGYPTRAQFGSVNYYSVTEIQQVQFIQNEVQYFKGDRCIVLPLGYAGAAFTTADIPPVLQTGTFSTASGYASTLGFYGHWDGTAGATGFYYDLSPTVVASFNISYQGRINDETLPGPISIVTFQNY